MFSVRKLYGRWYIFYQHYGAKGAQNIVVDWYEQHADALNHAVSVAHGA